MQTKIALITGIAGQDGSYLAELLLSKNYKVHGLIKSSLRQEDENWRINHIADKLFLHTGDVSNYETVYGLINNVQPDEIYHLATKHDIKDSLENYLEIQAVNINSVYYFLNAIKEIKPSCRFFFASSSKIFGKVDSAPQNEQTVFNPDSLYGVSKTAGMYLTKMYRDNQNIFACSGILYNHESPRRDPEFLPRKITTAAAKIKSGLTDFLSLGELEARRDWGFAGDYVKAMWLMLQADKPIDYVIGTGISHSVRDVLDIAFDALNLDWRKYVIIDKKFIKQKENYEIVADISNIKINLGWRPKVKFKDLIKMMVEEDFKSSKGKK